MFRIVATGVREALTRVAQGVATVARQALGQAAAYAAERARATTTFKDGPRRTLRKSIRRTATGPYRFVVGAYAQHALFVEENTKAHPIRPKLGANVSGPLRSGQGRRSRGAGRTVLRFVIGGKTFFRPSVRHPGTTGTHFMRDARDDAEKNLTRFVEVGLRPVTSG